MKKNIQLDDSQIKEFIDIYQGQKDKLAEQMNEIKLKVEAISNKMAPLLKAFGESIKDKSNGEVIIYDTSDYDVTDPKWKKGKWVLDKTNKEMTIMEIVEAIKKIEPNAMLEDIFERRYQKQISSQLGGKAIDGQEVYRRKNKDGIYVYGLLEWKEN